MTGIKTFDELPEVCDEDDLRRVHNTSALYFISRSGVAHADFDCMHLDGLTLVANPRWRVGQMLSVERSVLTGARPAARRVVPRG
jgi:hypothetical protein